MAKLVFPKQDPLNSELKAFWEDNMRIAPWRGLTCFQPMGSSNRVRRVGESLQISRAYGGSADFVTSLCEDESYAGTDEWQESGRGAKDRGLAVSNSRYLQGDGAYD